MATDINSEHSCIALTGASGFVGTHILKKLLYSGYRVRALQHQSKLFDHKNLNIVTGSLSDISSLKKLVKGTSHVIHCGGVVASNSKKEFFEANAKGTENIIRAAQDENVQSFLYISSLAARTPQLSPYAASKLAGEKILQTSTITSWNIIRPPAIYGPGDKQILPLIQLLQNRIGLLCGGRNARVSVIYVEDLVRAVSCWLASDTHAPHHGNIYEIDDGQENGYSWHDLLSMAANTMNIHPFYIAPPHFLLKAVSHTIKILSKITNQTPFLTPEKICELCYHDWVCRNRTIENNIHWKPTTNFREGIQKTLYWYQEKRLMNNLNLKDIE